MNSLTRAHRRVSLAISTQIVLSVIFVAMIFLPLVRMLTFLDRESFRQVTTSPVFLSAIKNSLLATSVSTVLTVLLAYGLAYSMERVDIRYKKFLGCVFMLPILIPSISHGMGLLILLGNNGILTNLLHLKTNIYGFHGVVTGSVLYSMPIAYMMLRDILKYDDAAPYEAAEILGIPAFQRFKEITFPYLRKPLIAVVFTVFSYVATDYGVPLMVGGKFNTIPVVMYQEVIGLMQFGRGVVYACLLLIPSVVAFLFDLFNKDRGNMGFTSKEFQLSKNKNQKIFSYILCFMAAMFVLMPLVCFLVIAFAQKYPLNYSFTLKHLQRVFSLNSGKYLTNSLIMSLGTAVFGVSIAFLTAYLAARMHTKTSRLLHLSAMVSAAVPGLALGLSYVLTFNKSAIYGTMVILVLVNIAHFISSPYLMMYNSLSKMNENLENVGHTLGIARRHMIVHVFIPSCKDTLLEMFSYFFVNCMITISAVSFLCNTANKSLALMITQFEAQAQFEAAAVVSLMILLSNLIVKGIIGMLHSKKSK